MPRVSEEHLERRRRQILDAARTCFARKGFHETSMQDVFRESGLSAGAVYRYFPSKDSLIQAIALGVAGRMGGLMEEMLAERPLPPIDETVARFADQIMNIYPDGVQFQLALQVWAAASHDAELARHFHVVMGRIRGMWIAYAEKLRELGRLPADADTDAVGKTLFSFLPGFILQRALVGDVDPDTMRRGMAAIIAPTALTSATPGPAGAVPQVPS